MYSTCFFQITEYVMAPFGLMLFTFYVKNIATPKSTVKPIIEQNGLESLFIACYSNLLYYLSLVSHTTGKVDPIYEHAKNGVLLAGFFGMIGVFILKYHGKYWGEEDGRSNSWPNRAALGLMFFLVFVIVFKNTHGFHDTHITLSREAFFQTCLDLLIFVTTPSSLITLVFTICICYLYGLNTSWFGRKVEKGVDEFSEIHGQGTSSKFIGSANNKENPPNIRVQSFASVAKEILDSGKSDSFPDALAYMEEAKALVLTNTFPINLEFGIVKLIVKIHVAMHNLEMAKSEMQLFESRNAKSKDADWTMSHEHWMKELAGLIP